LTSLNDGSGAIPYSKHYSFEFLEQKDPIILLYAYFL